MTGRARKRGLVTLAAALCLTGCGERTQRRAAPPPKLPHQLGLELAQRSDAVALALDAGDSCQALALAQDLQQRAISAINARRVAVPLQEPLQSAVNQLAGRIECVPPDEHGRGKGKGKKKHGKGDD